MIDKSIDYSPYPMNRSLLMSESSLNHQITTHYTHSISMCAIWKLHVPDDGRLASQHKQKIFNIKLFPLLFHTVCIL